MAKHPHRLLLNQKKTWKCVLPNCRYFIHIGLAHILPGQQSICWECGETFELSERALRDDMPHCDVCHTKRTGVDMGALDDFFTAEEVLKKTGVKSVEELTPTQRNLIEAVHGVKLDVLKQTPTPKEKDEIEVIEADENDGIIHDDECDIWRNMKCSCQ